MYVYTRERNTSEKEMGKANPHIQTRTVKKKQSSCLGREADAEATAYGCDVEEGSGSFQDGAEQLLMQHSGRTHSAIGVEERPEQSEHLQGAVQHSTLYLYMMYTTCIHVYTCSRRYQRPCCCDYTTVLCMGNSPFPPLRETFKPIMQ